MHVSWIFCCMLCLIFAFHSIVFHLLQTSKYDTVEVKWGMLGVSTFGLLRKTKIFIKLPFGFELVSLKRSELFYKN